MTAPLRLLFVAMGQSIHTARWVTQLDGLGWELFLFPIEDVEIHPYLGRFSNVRVLEPGGSGALAGAIEQLRPDIVHSLEIHQCGYRTLRARERLESSFPTWIVTNWGADLALHGRSPEHAARARAVLGACDYYACECRRDISLARDFGFRGPVLPVVPNAGGLDLRRLARLRSAGRPSARDVVLLKGYQGWAGRALSGLRALERCASELARFRICLYLASPEVEQEAHELAARTGLAVDVLPALPHEAMLHWHARARTSIGLSITDGISTSMLEALAMGSFPIQSNTSCADEWVTDGETALLVDPEDVDGIAAAISRALTDDVLVDSAAALNAAVADERLDEEVIRRQVAEAYLEVAPR